ncbi:hypothetical protein ACFXD5_12785 [Streptomyces sp. NPDC059385]|uniref:hypothetical protein n=1 Tax=Streptomyces sp. NPDC059385 TaxID=3346817 RepID=UPI00369E7E9F
MLHRAVRTVGVAGLALLSVLGYVPAAEAAAGVGVGVRGHGIVGAAMDEPSGDARLVFQDEGQQPGEPGGEFQIGILGMPSGWDTVSVTSPALAQPVPLVPSAQGATDSDRNAYEARASVPLGVAPGTYALTATSHGRTVATAQLTVAFGPAMIRRFGILRPDTVLGDPVRPGSTVTVLLGDDHPMPGEGSLVAKSPAFTKDVRIRTNGPDDPGCKCDDGSTLYTGHTTLRDDLPPGTYPLTVVSHHGRETHTTQIVLAGKAVATGPSWAVWGGIAAAVLVALAGAGALMRRRPPVTGA